ncbi:MAG: TonB-dependent receptor domain-containing protein [Salinivenus sp.]
MFVSACVFRCANRVSAVFGLLFAVGLLAGSPAPVQAQDAEEGTVQGRVVDAETDEPLEGTTVALWGEADGDSTLVAGTTTGTDGEFTVEADAQSYTLRISYVGYTDRRLGDVTPESEGTELGTIALSPETQQADEVEVTANRPAARMETDRNVYNTSESALNAGGSARTALENLPSIQVDMDGSISFRGSESVSVHINGEPASLDGQSLINYLESLPSDAIERIETIPNPSAKYEPEGMAGIINIVLRYDLDAGWTGGLTLGTERDAYGKYGGNLSGNVGYQASGWRLTGTYSHRRDSEEDTDSRFVEQLNGADPNRITEQRAREEEQDRSHSLNTQAEYSFSETTALELETSLSYRGDEESGDTEYWEYAGANGGLQDRYARVTDAENGDQSINGRLGFDHSFADDHSIDVQLRYDRDFESEDGLYNVFGYEDGSRRSAARAQENETINEDEQDGSLEVDYERTLGDIDLETGYKGTLRRLDNDQTFEGPETAYERVFTFDERIHAAYGTLSRGLGDFTLEAGLRGETVETTFDLSGDPTTENSYVSLYPSAFLTYKPGSQRQARLSYSKRVDRPNLWYISPLEDNEDPTFRREGNPSLDPEYIHSFELTLTQRWDVASLTVTPYVRHTVNEIDRVQREETNAQGEQIIVQRAENLSSSTAYGTELVGTFNVGERLEGRLNGSIYRSVTDGSNLTTDRSQDAILYSGRGSVQAQLRDGLQMEVSQFYRPGRDIPPQGRMDAFSSTELALRQQLFDGSGSLTLRVDDLFDQTEMNLWYRDQDIYQESNFQWGAREASLTFQYTFGGGEGQEEGGRRRRR